MTEHETRSSALLSDDGVHRFQLDRWWGDGERVTWVMLNPSTADATEDDPTIRRVAGFSKAWGYDGFTVVNLFSLRATNPAELWRTTHNNIGRRNRLIIEHQAEGRVVVAAWGAGVHRRYRVHVNATATEIQRRAKSLSCLGYSRDGHPLHPLYQPAAADLVPWPEPLP